MSDCTLPRESLMVRFNQVISLDGDVSIPVEPRCIELTTFFSFHKQSSGLIFLDNSKLETVSELRKHVVVNQNPNPLAAVHGINLY